ncbi:tetratricopeptide repeat protein [Colwellia echini]|nr:tetratricopeptide repeat protein [Colwellia echini]
MTFQLTQCIKVLLSLTWSIILALSIITLTSCSNTSSNNNSTHDAQSTNSSAQDLQLYEDAIVALNNNELDRAKKLFITMSERQPNMAGSWTNLALISIKQGNLAQANTYIKTALNKNPNMPQALNLAGYLAQKAGKIKLAESYYLQAINVKANYGLAHYNVALLYDVYLQNIPLAVEHYQRYLTLNEQKDEATANWLEGLKATMAASN